MPITDSYSLFMEDFSHRPISEDAFINWGIDHIIFADRAKAEEVWKGIKKNWQTNRDLWVRNSGRNGQSSRLYEALFTQFGKTVNFDATNNDKPTNVILSVTGKVKYKPSYAESTPLDVVRNYQVSHIWGHTKNPLLFVCPWNICLVPKMFDPFTGHEAKGPLAERFRKAFIDRAKTLYGDLICDYNDFLDAEILQTGIIDACILTAERAYLQGEITKRTFNDFEKNIKEEFAIIDL
jgi:hypothetical protein